MTILLINYIYIHINFMQIMLIYIQPIEVRGIPEIVEKDKEKSNNQKLN
jgi:hypothetical protein